MVRHAQAKHVAIELAEVNDPNGNNGNTEGAAQLALTVRDDGRGIDPATPPGFGLRGMQERVHALGGSYKVESASGHGTSVRIAIPLHDRQDG